MRIIAEFTDDKGSLGKAEALGGGDGGMRTESITSDSPSIKPENNTYYRCRELDILTIEPVPAESEFWMIRFISGATPTVTNFPEQILGLEDFAAEANTIYEINVLGSCASWKGWPLGGTS